jgi:FKBP-type peptidyl-prolyl cis-trans isomerase FklB
MLLGFLVLRAGAGELPALETRADRASYAAGVEAARSLRAGGAVPDPDLAAKGLRDGLAGAPLLLPEDELASLALDLRKERIRHLSDLRRCKAGSNRSEAGRTREAERSFLAENAARDGVTTLSSGLQYSVVRSGCGEVPSERSTVEVRYRGATLDGIEFARSGGSGGPETLKVSEVIPAWKEALLRMPAGSTWRLFVPPELAYGEKRIGRVAPGSTLLFDMELLAVR